MNTLSTADLYNAFALVGKDRADAMPYILGMMSTKMTQADYESMLETIRTVY
jgi:hypothetical protein